MTKAIRKMILDWKNSGGDWEPNWKKITVNDIRDAYLEKIIDAGNVSTWMYYGNATKEEIKDLLRELKISVRVQNHYYGKLTKEEEAWNRDYDFYKEENEMLNNKLTNFIKQFTTKKEWMDLMNWMNERDLIDETMYNSCKNRTEAEWLKFIKGKDFLGRKMEDVYIYELWNYNHKYQTRQSIEEEVNNMIKRYAYYSELLEYF